MAQQESSLCLEVNHKEEVAWTQLGHLRQWMPNTLSCQLTVPPAISNSRVLDTIRLLGNCFTKLQSLKVVVQGSDWAVGQPIIAGAAELLGLRSLSIEGGILQPHDLHLHVLTGLKQLSCLRLVGRQGEGLGDAALISGGLGLLTNLTRLELRGSTEELSDEGIIQLGSLVHLQHLSILPLGLAVTQEGLALATASMRHLTKLQLGFSCSQQADIMQALPEHVRDVEVVVSDEHAEPPSLLTTCALCVGSALTSLRMNTIKVEDASFLLALGALTGLTQLSLAATPSRKSTPGFMLNLVVLTQLKKLQSLEVAVVGSRLLLPLTAKQVPHLTAAWPQLTHLALSCMVPPQRLPGAGAINTSRTSSNGAAAGFSIDPPSGRTLSRESSAGRPDSTRSLLSHQSSLGLSSSGQWRGPLHPAALTLLNGFTALKRLALIEPLPDNNSDAGACLIEDSDDEDNNDTHHSVSMDGSGQAGRPLAVASEAQPLRRIPVVLATLPQSLTELVLERAELVQPASATTGVTAVTTQAAVTNSVSTGAAGTAATGPADTPAADVSKPAGDGQPESGAAASGQKEATSEPASGVNGDTASSTTHVPVPSPAQPPLLPHLQSLALSYCKADDVQLKQLFSSSQQLTHLELNEVHGITGATLQALTSLPHLNHLEVVDSRGRGRGTLHPPQPHQLHAPFANPSRTYSGDMSERSSAASASSATSWWSWLTGASTDVPASTPGVDAAVTVSVTRQGSLPNNSKSTKLRLQFSDIQHLASLSTLRHLQWGVGVPLRVPSALKQYEPDSRPSSNSGAALKDKDKDPALALGHKGYTALQAMRTVVNTVASEASQLKDLHELYIDAQPDGPDVDQERLMALLGLPHGYTTQAVVANSTSGRAQDKPRGTDASDGMVAVRRVHRRVPAWLAAAVGPACFVAGSLPTSEYDPWSNATFTKVL